jgi:hypothetical protein
MNTTYIDANMIRENDDMDKNDVYYQLLLHSQDFCVLFQQPREKRPGKKVTPFGLFWIQ